MYPKGLCALFSAWIMNGVLLQLEEISNAQNPQTEEDEESDAREMLPVTAEGEKPAQ